MTCFFSEHYCLELLFLYFCSATDNNKTFELITTHPVFLKYLINIIMAAKIIIIVKKKTHKICIYCTHKTAYIFLNNYS